MKQSSHFDQSAQVSAVAADSGSCRPKRKVRTAVVASLLAVASWSAGAAPALLGLYTFEGAGGNFANVVDASGNGKNPTYFANGVGVTTGNGGYQGEAATFTPQGSGFAAYSAPNGGFKVGIDISPSAAGLTIGGWLYLTPNATQQGLHTFFSHDNGGYDRGVWYQAGSDWQIMGGFPHSTGATFTTDAWRFVAVTYGGVNGTDARIYIDGTLAGVTGTSATSGEPDLRFGAYDNDSSTEPWAGKMDNLFVFDGALDATQIRTINANGLAGIQEIAGISSGNQSTVPEPGTIMLMAAGVLGLGFGKRKKG